MPKQYRLGKGTANIISSFEEKKEIINYLFGTINLSNYRFQILKSIDQLEFLKKMEHYVSPNFNGLNYLMIFMKLKNKNRTFLIDRRKLKYNKDQLDINTFLILEITFSAESELYQGTIIDGKLLRMNNNQYIYICNDCYHLFGKNITSQKLDIKYKTLDKIISSQMSMNPCYNFDFKINKLYTYDQLNQLINNVIPNSQLPINGIVFYPKISGTILLYSEKINENNKNEKTENNKNENSKKTITNFNKTNNKTDESYHIVRDLCSYLKSRSPTIENFNKYKQKNLILRKSDIPDVYFVYEDENKPQIGIAHIPNLKISQELEFIFENTVTKNFDCYYNTFFKKWTPLI